MQPIRSFPSLALAAILLSGPIRAQITTRASVASNEAQASGGSSVPTISANGRFVVFPSGAADLVPGDTNGFVDVFVRDLQTGTTERVSVDSGENQGNDFSSFPAISADGRFVVFESPATNLVAGDTNGKIDVFLRDRQFGTTERISLGTSGAEGNDHSQFAAISGDGNYVAFVTLATNLVAGDTNGTYDALVRDRAAATTVRVSVGPGGVEANGMTIPTPPSLSANGRYVGFAAQASNLVVGDTNGCFDVFVHDRQTGTTERVSLGMGGGEATNNSISSSLSDDGRYVAFWSNAPNLVPGDLNSTTDVFVYDRVGATTAIASVATGGAIGDGLSQDPKISADGRFVVFHSASTNLVAGDTNATFDVFVHDRTSGVTGRVSVDSTGAQGDGFSGFASVSGDGRLVAFQSASTNLVAGDTNVSDDIFLRDRVASGFTSLCDPGVGGVIACPCGNPPAGPGRGCNNSSNTGGATLSASGVAYLAADSLVFTTVGEKPTALSLLAQWIGGNATGVTFGMGVRCTSGTFKRLFSRNAVAGSVTLPNYGLGDPTVSARSAAKGDTILAGQSRWYVVYYRDNTVLGGCPALSNFNATQTGRVTWSP